MNVTVFTEIDGSIKDVWRVITDIENCQNVISGIKKISILNKPEKGLVGLKWEETREMFGKEAMETMWITESTKNEHYSTRAESHGAVYITTVSLKENAGLTLLTMSFSGEPQSLMAKVLSFMMSPFINGSIRKALAVDLQDIKVHVES